MLSWAAADSSAAASPLRSRPPSRTTRVEISDLVFEILEAARDREVIPLPNSPVPLGGLGLAYWVEAVVELEGAWVEAVV